MPRADARARLVHRNPRVLWHRLSTAPKTILLHLDTGHFHDLNGVGALIWQLIENAPSIELLHRRIAAELGENAPDDLETDVDTFIEQLAERGLIIVDRADPAR